MNIDNRKLRHDINSLFFKLETSISLLKNETTSEEKEIVIQILEKVEKKLKTFMTLNIFEKELQNFKPNIQKINLNNFSNLNDDILLETDNKLMEKVLETIFTLNKNEKTNEKLNDNCLILEGNFEIEDEIDKYFVEMLKKLAEISNLKLKINKKQVEISW